MVKKISSKILGLSHLVSELCLNNIANNCMFLVELLELLEIVCLYALCLNECVPMKHAMVIKEKDNRIKI